MIRLNLAAVLHVTRAYLPLMIEQPVGPDPHDRLRRRPQG